MGCYFCIIWERMSRQCQNTHNFQSDALVQAVLILLHTSKVYLVVWTPFKPLACQVEARITPATRLVPNRASSTCCWTGPHWISKEPNHAVADS